MKLFHNKQQKLRKLLFWLFEEKSRHTERQECTTFHCPKLNCPLEGGEASAQLFVHRFYMSCKALLQVKVQFSCLSGICNESAFFFFFLHKVYLKTIIFLFCNGLLWDKMKNFTNLFQLICIHRPRLHSPSLTYLYLYLEASGKEPPKENSAHLSSEFPSADTCLHHTTR